MEDEGGGVIGLRRSAPRAAPHQQLDSTETLALPAKQSNSLKEKEILRTKQTNQLIIIKYLSGPLGNGILIPDVKNPINRD